VITLTAQNPLYYIVTLSPSKTREDAIENSTVSRVEIMHELTISQSSFLPLTNNLVLVLLSVEIIVQWQCYLSHFMRMKFLV